MIIKILSMQTGMRGKNLSPVNFPLDEAPHTVRELITLSVKTCVTEYNKRVENGEAVRPLSKKEIDDMSYIGKIAFGINYGNKKQNVEKAIKNALISYEDGIFRIFQGDDELEGIDSPIVVNEGDEFTFIRLAMLAGG